MNTSLCDETLLLRSLEERLSGPQEELLAIHLSHCEACCKKLESLAADNEGWKQVGVVLREESSGEHPGAKTFNYALEHDFYDAATWKPSDFIVDFLQPSVSKDTLGRLGNIEIREFIGQGAHGIVLKGFQEELNRLVAVKVMAPHLASVVAARKRFAREARATAAISHPNVLPILHVDSTGQLPYLVMPYVDCESLQDRLDREGLLPVVEALRIGLQVARGLAAAHAQGLVHRDVKPANILLERGVERVMLTDFGLARAVDDATLTRSGLIAGTPHYMSPEQARGDAVDTRSDMFSLGSVLYAISTGRPPFRAESTYGILRRVTDDAPRPLCELNPEVPKWFDGIVLKLLNKSAADRFESADELGKLLEECLAHVQQPSSIPLPSALGKLMSRAKPHPRALPRPRRLYMIFGCMVTIVAAIFAVYGFSRGSVNSLFLDMNSKRGALVGEGASSPIFELDQAKESQREDELLPWSDGIERELRQLDNELELLNAATNT